MCFAPCDSISFVAGESIQSPLILNDYTAYHEWKRTTLNGQVPSATGIFLTRLVSHPLWRSSSPRESLPTISLPPLSRSSIFTLSASHVTNKPSVISEVVTATMTTIVYLAIDSYHVRSRPTRKPSETFWRLPREDEIRRWYVVVAQVESLRAWGSERCGPGGYLRAIAVRECPRRL